MDSLRVEVFADLKAITGTDAEISNGHRAGRLFRSAADLRENLIACETALDGFINAHEKPPAGWRVGNNSKVITGTNSEFSIIPCQSGGV